MHIDHDTDKVIHVFLNIIHCSHDDDFFLFRRKVLMLALEKSFFVFSERVIIFTHNLMK